VLRHILGIEQHVLEFAPGIHGRLVLEMRRLWVAALATGEDAFRPDAGTEFHGRDKAVAPLAVDALRRALAALAIRGQRAPVTRRIRHGQAGLRIVKRLHDISRQALEAD
jgi:hypothetical protein